MAWPPAARYCIRTIQIRDPLSICIPDARRGCNSKVSYANIFSCLLKMWMGRLKDSGLKHCNAPPLKAFVPFWRSDGRRRCSLAGNTKLHHHVNSTQLTWIIKINYCQLSMSISQTQKMDKQCTDMRSVPPENVMTSHFKYHRVYFGLSHRDYQRAKYKWILWILGSMLNVPPSPCGRSLLT